jgi:hypothetical protein
LDNGWSGEEVAKVLFVDTTRPGAGAGDTRKTGSMDWRGLAKRAALAVWTAESLGRRDVAAYDAPSRRL